MRERLKSGPAEEYVRSTLWADASFRRLRLDEGVLHETRDEAAQ